jgi:sugar lactone lactonase YvrE
MMRTLLLLAVASAPASALLPARTVAEFPVKTWLENLAIGPDGAIYATSYLNGKVHRVSSDGKASEFARVDGTISGIVPDGKGGFVIAGWAGGKQPALFLVGKNGGRAERVLALDQGQFPNGIAHLRGARYLVADSYKGVIWETDLAARTARIWLSDSLLARVDDTSPFPGVNGLKIFEGAVYASNTQRKLVLRIPVDERGLPGKPGVWAKDINLDDFAFDEEGNLYGATHVENGVVRITPSGQITVVADASVGMAGSTAVAFGTGKDALVAFVSTNGGMSKPPEGGPQPARIVRLEVGKKGAPIRF